MIRIGIGTDLHRLERNSRPLIIGSVHVPSDLGPVSHSDGDCLVHAIIDSLYGCLGLGDIGSHFPDSDQRYRDACSMDLLAQCYSQIKDKGYRLVNLDATVELDAPRLRPYVDSIRAALADALETDHGFISIKAKTTESTSPMTIKAIAACLVEN